MKAKDIIPEVMRPGKRDIENIPVGQGGGGGMPIPLNPAGQNVWRDRYGAPRRSPGDKPQNIDDVVLRQINQAGRRGPGGPIPVPPAPGEQYVLPGVLGVGGAVGTGIYAAASDKGAKPTGSQSTPQAPARDPNMTQQTQDRLGISLDSQGRTASGATSAQTPARPQQSSVSAELARLSGNKFATAADRLNQTKVNDILGPGYKAGSAAANLALLDYYQRQAIVQQVLDQTLARAREQDAAREKISQQAADNLQTIQTAPIGSNSSSSSGSNSAAPPISPTGVRYGENPNIDADTRARALASVANLPPAEKDEDPRAVMKRELERRSQDRVSGATIHPAPEKVDPASSVKESLERVLQLSGYKKYESR